MASVAPTTCATCELHAEAFFRVEGMDCSEEVVILERRLKPLAGVEAVSADVVRQRLHVKYDAAKLTTSAMVDAVGQTGMRMWLEHEEPRNVGSDVRLRLRLMMGSGAGIAAGLGCAVLGREVASVALYVAAAALGGVFPARRALGALRARTVDINGLMIVAVAGALAIGEWLEAASVVFLFSVAQWLEVRTLERARQAIRALLDLSPREALVTRNGVDERVPIESVTSADRVRIRPGDKIPVDGVVTGGHSDVNEAPITGESLPVDKALGDTVYAGTINGRGAMDLRVTRIGQDTRLAKIIHLVEDAQSRRAPVQQFVDRFARIYTPAVVALAAGVALAPPLLAGGDALTWLYRSLVLLVISCPCALVISTPVSIVAALSAAARHGVLMKGGAHLERLAGVRVIAFDKTGTLTRGELQVDEVMTVGSSTLAEVLYFAAAVESRSEHPIARAITAHARARGNAQPAVHQFVSVPGAGARAQVDGRRVLIGNQRLMATESVTIPGDLSEVRTQQAGRSLVFVVVDGAVRGAIAVSDRPRETAREAIELLRQQGITRIAMLTGDHAGAARTVAQAVGLDECHSALLPDQKHALVEAMRASHGPVAMVGDGVNDAPALASADVGVSMGAAGSDAALETADVALMSDELLKLPYAIRLSRATLRTVRINVGVSLALKAVFMVMAVTGSATLWMAVLADTGASVIVVANALRLLRTK